MPPPVLLVWYDKVNYMYGSIERLFHAPPVLLVWYDKVNYMYAIHVINSIGGGALFHVINLLQYCYFVTSN